MQELIDGLLLYHGSYCEVKQPDLLESAKYKDFGQGFYITSSKKQAGKASGSVLLSDKQGFEKHIICRKRESMVIKK